MKNESYDREAQYQEERDDWLADLQEINEENDE